MHTYKKGVELSVLIAHHIYGLWNALLSDEYRITHAQSVNIRILFSLTIDFPDL